MRLPTAFWTRKHHPPSASSFAGTFFGTSVQNREREIPEVAPFTATAGQETNASGAGKPIRLAGDSDQAKQPLYCNLKLTGLVAD